MPLTDATKALVESWLAWDNNAATRAEVDALVAAEDEAELAARMGHHLEFGTAGLRAPMGAGFSRMNDVTVIQAAQGLAAYLHDTYSAEECRERGVVIGFDARHNSTRFARLSANVFLAGGIRARLTRQICPTPYVPFGVRRYRCLAGVMVTASHNPKNDNGYKVYAANGAQIISPTDVSIAAAIASNQVPTAAAWAEQPGAEDPFDDIEGSFFGSLATEWRFTDLVAACPTKFTYTAMHGVGTPFTVRALKEVGVASDRIVLVKEQVEPDPEFPTVTFPNPEEGKSALNLSFAAADAAGSNLILANDPDADRLAVAERTGNAAAPWKVYTGNEIGALFGWWTLKRYVLAAGPGADLAKVAMLSSAVSSAILRTMAAREGFYFEPTLTGFKYMGSKADELERDRGMTVLFAFEEAIGFMIGRRVWDKDGVTAAAVFAEMTAWLHANEQRTPMQQLQHIYSTYGYHCSYNSYMVSPASAQTQAVFNSIRTAQTDGGYPSHVAGAAVVHVRDLSTGLDTAQPDRKATLPLSTVSPMITFTLDNGVTLTVRGSGTEPKLKWYSEIVADTVEGTDTMLRAFVDAAVKELMQPERFGLQPRAA